MRRAPSKNHTYGNVNRAKTAEELQAEANAKSNAAYLSIMQEFCDSLIALSKSENPG